jgi:hypothetical protein
MQGSTNKPARSSSRAKSAYRGRSEMFNSTTPIKFVSNLEESIRDSLSRGHKGNKSKPKGAKDQLANSQVIIISGQNQAKSYTRANLNVKTSTKHTTLNNTIYMTNQSVVDSVTKNNEKELGRTQTLLQTT